MFTANYYEIVKVVFSLARKQLCRFIFDFIRCYYESSGTTEFESPNVR
jgi:hypothetical protein